MAIPWRIELLGHLRATRGERVITRFRTQKTAALLAYLAYYAHRSHPRGELVELFWADSDPEDGRHSLSQALSSLRSLLEPPDTPAGTVLVADRAWVQLAPQAVVTDVAEWQAALRAASQCDGGDAQRACLAAAVEQFGGELLPGHVEQWVLLERQRLHELWFRALDILIVHHEAAGDLGRALELARHAVQVDPLREEAHREVIRLLDALGRPGDALRQYHALERLLREELDTQPSLDVRSLVTKARQAGSPASEAPESRPDHLPRYLTRFFGRQDEIARLCRLLGGEADPAAGGPGLADAPSETREPARLVALTGPGGSGKTRLAVEATHRLILTWSEQAPEARREVLFVSLADLTDPARIPELIRDTVGLPHSPEAEALEQVVIRLAAQPTLLLLDNFEHLVDGGISPVRQLLDRVPSLICLVTSRRCLGIDGEQEQIVLPLPVPGGSGSSLPAPPAAGSSAPGVRRPPRNRPGEPRGPRGEPEERVSNRQRITASPSIQLFADRARLVYPEFAVTARNAAAVAALCRRLDGVPLAIELAASRASVLTPEQMLARLEGAAHTSPVLATARGDTHERHRSLRATLDWSYRLLSPELQQFFARLSVFRGGWTEEAAEAVCEEPLALDYLAQLRDCSLVLTETFRVRAASAVPADVAKAGGHPAQPPSEAGTTEVRFRMLETLREYASAQLHPSERAALERRHAEYYIALLNRQWRNLVGPQQPVWLQRFGREMENLRLACDWCIEADEPKLALRFGAQLCWFLGVRGHSLEARARVERILALPGASLPAAGRAGALQAAGLQAFWQGDHTAARTYYEESLSLRHAGDDPYGEAWLLSDLGLLEREEANLERARACFEESLAMFQRLGREEEAAAQLNFRGSIAHIQGDYRTAIACYEQSLAIARPRGDSMMLASALDGLGDLARRGGQFSRARQLLEEAHACFERMGNAIGVACLLGSLSVLAFDLGEWPEAERLCERSLALARQMGNTWHVPAMLVGLGRISGIHGDTERAVVRIEEGLRLYREQRRAVGEGWALHELGCVLRRRGDHAAAEARCREALAIRNAVGDRPGAVESLHLLSIVAADQDDARRAVRLLGMVERFVEPLESPIRPAFQTEHERRFRSLRAALGERGFMAAWAAGRALDWEEAVAYALRERDLPSSAPGAGGDAFPALTDAQWAAIRPVIPSRPSSGRPRVEDRRALNGILYLLWSGCRWRHLPRDYGSPATCWRRLNEWRASGVWDRLCNAFLATLDDDLRSEWETLLATRLALTMDARPAPASGAAADK